jgi:hypothetical protein
MGQLLDSSSACDNATGIQIENPGESIPLEILLDSIFVKKAEEIIRHKMNNRWITMQCHSS